MDEWSFLLVFVSTAGVIGLTMMFVGFLAAMATAFGNKHWGWGIAILLVGPSAIFYCLSHPNVAAWPRGLLLKGMSIAGVAFVAAYLLAQQIARPQPQQSPADASPSSLSQPVASAPTTPVNVTPKP